MICILRGIVYKGELPMLTVDVGGVGYGVQCTNGLWETAKDGEEMRVHTYTFVREDRLELFGFQSDNERKLFTHFLSIPGIGPRTALLLCGISVGVLMRAVETNDTRALSSLKGIGKKMAEKLLLELQTLVEKGVISGTSSSCDAESGIVDEDALEALTNLGYDRRSIINSLREVKGLKTTEERVKKVLQTL